MALFMLKAVALWGVFLVLAFLNAMLREKLISPLLGQTSALPLSGVALSLFIFLTTLAFIPTFGVKSSNPCWALGGFWVLLTLAFEYLFGHYGMGKSWSEILPIFNVAQGNLMVLVLFTAFISPYLAWRLRA